MPFHDSSDDPLLERHALPTTTHHPNTEEATLPEVYAVSPSTVSPKARPHGKSSVAHTPQRSVGGLTASSPAPYSFDMVDSSSTTGARLATVSATEDTAASTGDATTLPSVQCIGCENGNAPPQRVTEQTDAVPPPPPPGPLVLSKDYRLERAVEVQVPKRARSRAADAAVLEMLKEIGLR